MVSEAVNLVSHLYPQIKITCHALYHSSTCFYAMCSPDFVLDYHFAVVQAPVRCVFFTSTYILFGFVCICTYTPPKFTATLCQ